jgi:hypothetical protein
MQTRSFPSTPDGRSPAGAEIRYLCEGETGGMILRSDGASRRTASASTTQASRTCSQLSRTSSIRLEDVLDQPG